MALKRSAWIVLIVAVFFLESGSARIVSMAVGRVREFVVTSREVQLNDALEQVLYSDKPAKISKDFDSSSFSKKVTAVLLEWVVHLEAKNLQVAPISATEVTAAQARAEKALKGNSTWKALQPTKREIEGIISRKLQAKKFIRFRADSSVLPVSDQEAQRYFEQNRTRFGNMPFENFRANIKTFLAREQVESRLKDWFEVLQSKYQVRNFLAEL